MSYGYCPRCLLPGVERERRINGNDRCEGGHTYPSRDSLPFPTNSVTPVDVQGGPDEVSEAALAVEMSDLLTDTFRSTDE